MRKIFLIMIWTIIWLALESTVLNELPLQNMQIDFVFLAVVSLSFTEDTFEGVLPVALIGFLTDTISPAPFGLFTTIYLIAFLAVRFATSAIYLSSPVSRFFWTMIASAIAIWLKALLTALIYKNPQFIVIATWRFIPQSVFNGVAGVFIIPLFGWYAGLTWEKITRPKGLVLR
ncbi:MAG: hypothetical protein COV46_04945 [Deltaproteobacteria bacterium CG11_big_fil_rev_8_21_14_0_20_49_13]|nr:MAG: hypothetical protein COV46_04945 [Deltaproteobacteria bacterium CG11_big_fil_rev_8_21_14_0_20_49_13]